jgi:hypothetical protein
MAGPSICEGVHITVWLSFLKFTPTVKISTKSCPAYTHVSWKRKLGNGGKSTRSIARCPSPCVFHSSVFGWQALQLLEYLIKHGSERVVDDARSHVSTLKMLRNFHYVDERGKDEGINGLPS